MDGFCINNTANASNYARIERSNYTKNNRNVNETRYYLPKGAAPNLLGSYSYEQPSLKSGVLTAKLRAAKRRLNNLLASSTSTTDIIAKRSKLNCEIKYLEQEISKEEAGRVVQLMLVLEV